jgi:hypothetical protein
MTMKKREHKLTMKITITKMKIETNNRGMPTKKMKITITKMKIKTNNRRMPTKKMKIIVGIID